MRRTLFIAVCATVMHFGPLFGQGSTLVGSGYSNPIPIRVSPGQITTFFVSGLSKGFYDPQKATGLPLPNVLGGISVTINQYQPNLKQSYSVPLLGVQQLIACSAIGGGGGGPSSDCLLWAITVQIPYEISFTTNSNLAATAEVIISKNDTASKAFTVLVASDNLHVLNTCDPFPPKQGSQVIAVPDPTTCSGVVTHADGTMVSVGSPAKAGETVVIYAYGLGQTTPAVKTGTATPTPAPTLLNGHTVTVQFDFRPNAGPALPYINPLIMAPFIPGAIFAGLTPGQVGLYQINVKIPDTVPSVPSCTGTLGGIGNGFTSTVLSNVTIDIGGVSSFDGAAICVQPPH